MLMKIYHYRHISLGHFINLDDISGRESRCVIMILSLSNAYIFGFPCGVGSKYVPRWVTLLLLQVVR